MSELSDDVLHHSEVPFDFEQGAVHVAVLTPDEQRRAQELAGGESMLVKIFVAAGVLCLIIAKVSLAVEGPEAEACESLPTRERIESVAQNMIERGRKVST